VRSGVSTNYAARHDLTFDTYQREFETWTRKGLRTQVVTGYKSGSSHRFAALWRGS
jgi:predicted phosphoadenosine phosphosulfate sulfurtransferase